MISGQVKQAVSGNTSLLTTNLNVPRIRIDGSVIARQRLNDRLDQALSSGQKLTLISAPPGFGKTTLVVAWARRCERCMAWLSLDHGDNDPIRFWTYFVKALQTLQPGLGESALSLLQSPQLSTTSESFLTALLNAIGAFPDEFALVLDDYHVINAQPLHSALAYLIDHMPPQMHLLIIGRADPPLPLAHWRARGQVNELRIAELRFTLDEATAFLNQAMGLDLPPEDIAILGERTEGWIAGLQLAALSMRGDRDAHGFVSAFTGSHRFIVDYLVEEVLRQWPEPVQAFLRQTSILDRLSGPICDYVTGSDDSQAQLEAMERANLFIIPLDNERRCYRYHHLFADVLRHQLQVTQPDRVPELHCRASEWYERAGMMAGAVCHALAACAYDRAARLIEQVVEPLWQRGEIATLTGWIQALPDAVRRAQPSLCLTYARALIDTAQFAAAEACVADAEYGLAHTLSNGDDTAVSLRGRVAALRAHLARTRGEFAHAIELSRRAEELLAADDLAWRSFVALNLAGVSPFISQQVEKCQTYTEAGALSQSAGDRMNSLAALSMHGEVLQAQGHLHQAVRQYEQTLELARLWDMPQAPVTGYALIGLGRVACERNDLDAALRYVQLGFERGKQIDLLDVLLRGHLVVARVRQAQGNLAGAWQALQEVQPIVERMGVAGVQQWVDALRAQVWLAQGDLDAAARWAAGYEGSLPDAMFPGVSIALARVRLAQGQHDAALRLLEHALDTAEEIGRFGNVIAILAVKAVVHRAQGDSGQALAELSRALALAEPEGYMRIFLDEGAPLMRLLRRLAERSPVSSYVRQLLAVQGEAPDVGSHGTVRLIEPLSQREIEVLCLMAEGATNREIADELVMAVNTVKKHTSNIFGKLSVNNRMQAIVRARDLSLL